ncbi:NADP-dependent oxidoreductase [Ruania zhangjianzhongii]|uniref:NADP-dependent oxidoreductase n=1 Tax=Ruania zhangjianzhongii TaxID=2603206 RepID=UPI0011C95CEC|nr:NADP-dependent oxidoreductase [Ruania zhangjianzhongii]
MRAVRYHEYGNPDVLRITDAPTPEAGPGQVRIAVGAASVNRMDVKLRSGAMASGPLRKPRGTGLDAAGVVDQVGPEVTGVQVGDRVFGAGSAVLAERAVLSSWAPVPDGLSLTQAAALPTVAETAGRVLGLLPDQPGSVLVVDGASGGVGTILVQLALRRGLAVIGTASAGKQELVRRLGATPVPYGPGLVERVRALASHVDGAADLAGHGSAGELVELVGDAGKVVTIADFSGSTEAVVTSGSEGRSWDTMAEVADLVAAGELELLIDGELDWSEAAEAHRRCESGQATGKIVLTVGAAG